MNEDSKGLSSGFFVEEEGCSIGKGRDSYRIEKESQPSVTVVNTKAIHQTDDYQGGD
jgi:hypothetical protein